MEVRNSVSFLLKDWILTFCHFSFHYQTWLGLFGNARSEVKVMSQWAIDGVGRSLDIFNQMKNAAERGVKLSLLFTAHDTAKMDSGFAPYDLINHQLKDGQVRLNTY